MSEKNSSDDRPNIVFILCDDMGAWAMGCAGNSEIKTPNLDALAASGTRFDNFFCASPVCSPARASILTGRIPSQHGVHDWIMYGNSLSEKRQDDRDPYTIEYLAGLTGYTDVLDAGGYTCGLSGKWHMGASDAPQKGFGFWKVLPRNGGSYRNPLFSDGKEFFTTEGYQTDIITDFALEFLDERVSSDEENPFYLSVHYFAPHAPWLPELHPEETVKDYLENCPFESIPKLPMHPWMHNRPEKNGRVYPEKNYPRDEQERRERIAGYYTAITEIDRNVGRILEALEQHGIRENTLLVFTGDNGMNLGQHGIYGKGNGTFPQNMYDTSVKVPMIVNRPGHVPAGKTETSLFSHYDVMPTLLEYVGLENPEADKLPGRSFAPLLRGEKCDGRGRVVVFDEYGPVRMIRTPEWKYVHRYPYGPHELYDLNADPGELHNLMTAVGMSEKIEEMRGELRAWFQQYVDPERDGLYEPVTGDGQIDLCGPRAEGRPAFNLNRMMDVHGAGLSVHRYP